MMRTHANTQYFSLIGRAGRSVINRKHGRLMSGIDKCCPSEGLLDSLPMFRMGILIYFYLPLGLLSYWLKSWEVLLISFSPGQSQIEKVLLNKWSKLIGGQSRAQKRADRTKILGTNFGYGGRENCEAVVCNIERTQTIEYRVGHREPCLLL